MEVQWFFLTAHIKSEELLTTATQRKHIPCACTAACMLKCLLGAFVPRCCLEPTVSLTLSEGCGSRMSLPTPAACVKLMRPLSAVPDSGKPSVWFQSLLFSQSHTIPLCFRLTRSISNWLFLFSLVILSKEFAFPPCFSGTHRHAYPVLCSLKVPSGGLTIYE